MADTHDVGFRPYLASDFEAVAALWTRVNRELAPAGMEAAGRAFTDCGRKRRACTPTASAGTAHLLSGLLRCGCCGSRMSVHDRDKTGKTRIRCSAVRESGSCTNRRIVYLREIEKAVLSGMREELKDRRLIEGYARKYNEERQRLRLQQRRRGHVSNQSALALRVSGNETSTWW